MCNLEKLTKNFLQKAKLKHKGLYTYDKLKYLNNKTKVVITCLIHGDFECTPDNLLNKSGGCPKCHDSKRYVNKTKIQERFIKKAKIKFGNKYDYSKVIYEDSYKKVEIICPIHGPFWQNTRNHLNNRGCPKCSKLTRKKSGGCTKTQFIKKYKKSGAYLYVIGMKSKSELFIKIGITGRTLKARILDFKSKYEVIKFLIIKNESDKIYYLERWLHRQLKENKYSPNHKFKGYTECFNFKTIMDIPKLLLINPIIKT